MQKKLLTQGITYGLSFIRYYTDISILLTESIMLTVGCLLIPVVRRKRGSTEQAGAPENEIIGAEETVETNLPAID